MQTSCKLSKGLGISGIHKTQDFMLADYLQHRYAGALNHLLQLQVGRWTDGEEARKLPDLKVTYMCCFQAFRAVVSNSGYRHLKPEAPAPCQHVSFKMCGS